MGTRNLTAVKINGEYKIAQYGQWDGYPSGQGATAVKFLRSERNRNKLKKALTKVRWVTEQELSDGMKKLGLNEDGWMTMEEAARWKALFPYLTRDHCAEILEIVATSKDKDIPLQNSLSFVADSLFCEWCYVVDFDTNTFEVYKGFNQTPLKKKERFFTMPPEAGQNKKYHPVRHVKTYKLGRIPKVETFIKQINKLTHEEE